MRRVISRAWRTSTRQDASNSQCKMYIHLAMPIISRTVSSFTQTSKRWQYFQ
ncbi:hypothetical protein BSL78_18925 [Apostichopus japonicus]|uniref:Uncharacterized protein n=1 Tax=Stichopus japonicus TaxID=307972 RepID=A0A2G8K884_STIJA|nr:hypothetical protein BSL78_18925 [Apostichopus japonicus]